ncbi:MAG: cytochrome C biogenesis protein, partial [Psychrobacter sp.]|nr:cytochrome C biogenesis protein [Psychrobacter sp.]
MSIKTIEKKPSLTVHRSSKKSYLLAFAVSSSSLFTGLAAMPMMTHAAGLGDLFSSDKNAAQTKFLPVDKAFQVSDSSKATNNGTRLAINFDITPEHYVYKDQIKL